MCVFRFREVFDRALLDSDGVLTLDNLVKEYEVSITYCSYHVPKVQLAGVSILCGVCV